MCTCGDDYTPSACECVGSTERNAREGEIMGQVEGQRDVRQEVPQFEAGHVLPALRRRQHNAGSTHTRSSTQCKRRRTQKKRVKCHARPKESEVSRAFAQSV